MSHSHRTQGDLTPNFPTFSKPILNLDFYINVDPGSTQVSNVQENSVESCTNVRFCHQAPILQLRLCLWSIFGRKNIFYKTDIEDGQKVHRKSASLITICIFYRKKYLFFCKNFGIFEVFSNSTAWWQNLRLVHNSTLFS